MCHYRKKFGIIQRNKERYKITLDGLIHGINQPINKLIHQASAHLLPSSRRLLQLVC